MIRGADTTFQQPVALCGGYIAKAAKGDQRNHI